MGSKVDKEFDCIAFSTWVDSPSVENANSLSLAIAAGSSYFEEEFEIQIDSRVNGLSLAFPIEVGRNVALCSALAILGMHCLLLINGILPD